MADNATPNQPARPMRYPEYLGVLISTDLDRAIRADAARESAATGKRVSRATIARRYMEAGRAITDAAEGVAAASDD